MSLGVGSSSFDPPPRLPPPPRRAAGRDESRSGSGNRYEDVTELFKQSCSSLALGQMVHPASFTLLDSMACISIGDPRMDSGVYPLPRDLIPESDRIATSSQTLTFNPHKALDVDETTWIIDRLASCHVAFHGGAPLSQTLYTSLYFHHLNSIPGDDSDPQHLYTQILRAYLVATIKCFGLAWQELVAGNLIEGEDTITDTCQISLYEEMPVGYAIGELQRGIAALKTVEQQEALERKGKGISGLILRLSIVKNFTMIFTLFQETLSNQNLPQETLLPPSIVYQQINNLCAQTSKLLDRLTPWEAALVHAPSPHAASSFDPLYARRLENAGGVPPRPADLPSPTEMITTWRHLLKQWQQAVGIYSLTAGGGLLPAVANGAWTAIATLSDKAGVLCEQRPNSPYMRSLWQSCLCPPSNPQPSFLVDFLATHAHAHPEGQSQLRVAAQRALADLKRIRTHSPLLTSFEYWQRKAESLLSNHLLNCMASRPRQKRHLAKTYSRWRRFIEETRDLQTRCEDEVDPSGGQQWHEAVSKILLPFAAAAHAHSLKIALTLTLSAFDLELYSPDEYRLAYGLAVDIGRECDAAAAASADDSQDMLIMCTVWMHLDAWQPSRSPSRSAHLLRANFFKRFKWLLLPSRDAHGNRQDPYAELQEIWDDFSEKPEDAPESLATLQATLENLIVNIDTRKAAIKNRSGGVLDKRYHLCRDEAIELLDRMQQSAQTTLRTLQSLAATGVNGIDASNPSPAVEFASVKTPNCHPWFPPLVVKRRETIS